MPNQVIDQIVALWSEINPVASYTSGYSKSLTNLLFESDSAIAMLKDKICTLETQLHGIESVDLQQTA